MLLQASASGGQVQKRKKLWICLWFLISSLIPDTCSISPMVMKQTASYQDRSKNSTEKSPISISNTKVPKNTYSRIQRAVPPRAKEEVFKEQQDKLKETANDEDLGYVLKVPIHIILMEEEIKNKLGPTPIISRTVYKYKNGSPRSQYEKYNKPNRFGRSTLNYNFEENATPLQQDVLTTNAKVNNKIEDSLTENAPLSRFSISDLDSLSGDETKSKPFGEDQDTEYDFNNLDTFESKYKRENSDYVVPQVRYGRSMILLSSSKSEKFSTDKPPHSFVLPYPRPGRHSEDSISVIPYPRPGRYAEEEMVDGSARYTRQGYMVPSARLGRSPSNVRLEENNNNAMGSPEAFLGLKVNPLFFKSTEYKIKDEGDNNSNFVIPYPRPGKRTFSKVKVSSTDDNVEDMGKKIIDFVLPYPLSGKESVTIKSFKPNRNSKPLTENFILPYPRPGRAYEKNTGNRNAESSVEFLNNFAEKQSLEMEDMLMDSVGTENIEKRYKPQSAKNTLIPYARMGRNFDEEIYNNLNMNSKVQVSSEDFENDYNLQPPSFEDIFSNALSKRSNNVVPYPRVGRANAVVPYPRPGRSSSVVPYPRPGRSDAVVPYPRLGRSDSLLPYPRPGRASSDVTNPLIGKSSYFLSNLRPEIPNSLIPNLRPGRSPSVVPYPRPGRSKSDSEASYTVVPYPRPGRSKSMISNKRSSSEASYSIVPYPRPGRSFNSGESQGKTSQSLFSNKITEKFSSKRDGYVLPYLRPGRTVRKKDTTLILPYPRPGRSSNQQQGYVLPHPRIGRSEEDGSSENVTVNTVIPYPRLGRSEIADIPPLPPEISNSVHKLNKHMLKNVDDSVYLLPYPRPGRSQ